MIVNYLLRQQAPQQKVYHYFFLFVHDMVKLNPFYNFINAHKAEMYIGNSEKWKKILVFFFLFVHYMVKLDPFYYFH